jgi:hypothetical protein
MKKALAVTVFLLIFAAVTLVVAGASSTNQVSISVKGDQLCIQSKGTPNHSVGQFRKAGA